MKRIPYIFVFCTLITLSVSGCLQFGSPVDCEQVTGVLWEDTNANGIINTGEKRLEGEEVRLVYEDGSGTVKTTTTNGLGRFSFDAPGFIDFHLEFPSREGYQFGPHGRDNNLDSNGQYQYSFSQGDDRCIQGIGAGYILKPASQPGKISIPASIDTYTNKFLPDQSFSTEETFWVYGENSRGYLEFPLTDIPQGADITSAILTLNIHPNSLAGGNALNISLFESPLSGLGLDDFNWDNQPMPVPDPQAASFPLNNYDASRQQSQDSFDVTGMVQLNWKSGSANAPLHLVFLGTWQTDTSQEWYSSESGKGPTLEVQYTTP